MTNRIPEIRFVGRSVNSSMRLYADDCAHIIGVLDAQAAEIERLRMALQVAVTQNECDMLLTGEELRECRKALGDCND